MTAGDSPGAADELIETSLAAAAVAYVRQGRGFVHEEPALTWVSTGSPIPFYSGVVRARLRNADADRIIDGVVAEFHARGWMMGWWVMPPSRPVDLPVRLAAHGFTPWTGDLGMAVNLADVPETVPLPPDVTVERVHTMEPLEDWLRAFGAGFGIPASGLAIYRRLPAGVPPSESMFRFYLARSAGVPVATSMWFPAPEAAVIDEIATVPAMRRRGIGTAVTHAVLRDAHMTGYRTAVLVASNAGESVYRRLGFKAHGRRRIYLDAPLPRYR